jgi:hypothetical protein
VAKKDSRELREDGTVEGSGPQPKEKGAAPSPVEADVERGLHGLEVDPTPNEHYTVAGVTSGKPTPETDAKAAEAARKRLVELGENLSR